MGYLIAWRNPDVKLKDGSTAGGKMILIDGQQRVTALTAAVLGQQVINKDYKKTRITIAFHPIDEKFEVANPAIRRNAAWIDDVAAIIGGEIRLTKAITQYLQANPDADPEKVEESISNLTGIAKKQIGLIELSHDLDIETVTEIFIRINSKGTVLSQADFAMSKIAADQHYGGPILRKCIDYFCHLAVAPEFHGQIQENDPDFAASEYLSKVAWLKDENDDLYDPSYNDLLRVAFTTEFGRGKLADLVSLLSGRNFETKNYEEEIAEESFQRLRYGVLNFINEHNFKKFVMIIKSAGFINRSMIRSQGALNFAYVLYLALRARKVNDGHIESYVRRWFVMSVLTGRYSSSPETQFDWDIRQIAGGDFAAFLAKTEEALLSKAFWDVGLVQALETSGTGAPYFWVFVAAQIRANDKGLLSKDITVRDLVGHLGDIHHIFPRDYLKKQGLSRWQYNQIANYVYTQNEINIRIGNKAPNVYFSDVLAQCQGGPLKYGAITDLEILKANLDANCLPESIVEMDIDHFDSFLRMRRQLMASKIRYYYQAL